MPVSHPPGHHTNRRFNPDPIAMLLQPRLRSQKPLSPPTGSAIAWLVCIRVPHASIPESRPTGSTAAMLFMDAVYGPSRLLQDDQGDSSCGVPEQQVPSVRQTGPVASLDDREDLSAPLTTDHSPPPRNPKSGASNRVGRPSVDLSLLHHLRPWPRPTVITKPIIDLVFQHSMRSVRS